MVAVLADQPRHMTGGSDDVMEVMERNIPLDGSACSGSRTCKRSSSSMHRYGVLCGEEVVRSRVGAAPRCVLMEADADTGLFWCAVSHVFEFAPTTRGRREFEAGVCPVRDPLEHQSASYGGILPVAGPKFTRKRCRVRRRASCAVQSRWGHGAEGVAARLQTCWKLQAMRGFERERPRATRRASVAGQRSWLLPIQSAKPHATPPFSSEHLQPRHAHRRSPLQPVDHISAHGHAPGHSSTPCCSPGYAASRPRASGGRC